MRALRDLTLLLSALAASGASTGVAAASGHRASPVTDGLLTWEADFYGSDGHVDRAVVKIVHAGHSRVLLHDRRFASYSPDGRWLLSEGTEGPCRMWQRRVGTSRDVHVPFRGCPRYTWAPRGHRLLIRRRSGFAVYDARLRRVRHLRVLRNPSVVFDPSWSPDGRWLAATGVGPNVTVVDARSGRSRRLPAAGPFSATWSADSRRLIVQ